ncbi:MAG TPA: ABC transporter ATP-binding protein [Acidobacteriaceae bacterium]|nr:ABC transporter ATP-binding protein [Acidobacteriaceae bacterium]
MPTFEMRKIVKRFPGVVANRDVDLTIEAGEIHALLGENGAGKSTLMQILYGFHAMDSGSILIDGKAVGIASPRDAIALGIGMVHQEFMLVPSFTVAENTVLGLEGKLDLREAGRRLRALSEQHHLAVDPDARVQYLPIGVQQRVEILKLLYRDARLLILDEPTGVLTTHEKDRLFTVLRGLRAQGRSIVIVTHKLQEIVDLADRVTVMRDGRVVATVSTQETTEQELARLMVGREVNLRAVKAPVERGEAILRIQGLHVRDEAGQEKVRGVSLEVHAGEILGIAGVDGNGQSQLAEAIMHLLPADQGRVFLKEREVTRLTVAQHRALGLAYVPADRRQVGAVTELSIADNAILGSQRKFTWGPFLDWQGIREHAEKLIARFGVRASSSATKAGKLSGGNLQKLILGREILENATAMVVEQPTRGLDVGAIESIWAELLSQREGGKAILLISAELEELMNLADRIAVMFEGRIAGILDAASVTSENLGLMISGLSEQA